MDVLSFLLYCFSHYFLASSFALVHVLLVLIGVRARRGTFSSLVAGAAAGEALLQRLLRGHAVGLPKMYGDTCEMENS